MNRRHLAAFAATLLLAAVPAFAQDRPMAVTPTRDVAVDYEMLDGRDQGRREVHMAWQASSQTLRLDSRDLPGTVLVDTPARRALMLMSGQRMAMQIPIDSLPHGEMASPQALAGQITGRAGTATVAGRRCTLWRFRHEAQGRVTSGTACLTEDGVLLRLLTDGNRPSRLEATRVDYGRQDPADFAVPPGYRRMDASGLGPAIGALLGQGGRGR